MSGWQVGRQRGSPPDGGAARAAVGSGAGYKRLSLPASLPKTPWPRLPPPMPLRCPCSDRNCSPAHRPGQRHPDRHRPGRRQCGGGRHRRRRPPAGPATQGDHPGSRPGAGRAHPVRAGGGAAAGDHRPAARGRDPAAVGGVEDLARPARGRPDAALPPKPSPRRGQDHALGDHAGGGRRHLDVARQCPGRRRRRARPSPTS